MDFFQVRTFVGIFFKKKLIVSKSKHKGKKKKRETMPFYWATFGAG
jgi:hypothetical protein